MSEFEKLLRQPYVDMNDFIITCKNYKIDLEAATNMACRFNGVCYTLDKYGYVIEDPSITLQIPQDVNTKMPARRSYEQAKISTQKMSAIDVCRLVCDTESIKECQVMIGMLEARIGELKCQR